MFCRFIDMFYTCPNSLNFFAIVLSLWYNFAFTFTRRFGLSFVVAVVSVVCFWPSNLVWRGQAKHFFLQVEANTVVLIFFIGEICSSTLYCRDSSTGTTSYRAPQSGSTATEAPHCQRMLHSSSCLCFGS